MKQGIYNYIKSESFINRIRIALFILSSILLLLGLFYFLLLAIKFNKIKAETNSFKNYYSCEICIEDLITQWNETELYLRNYTLDNSEVNYRKYKSGLLLLDSLLLEFQQNYSHKTNNLKLSDLISTNHDLERSLQEIKSDLNELIEIEQNKNFSDTLQLLREQYQNFSTFDSNQINFYIDSLINLDSTTIKERLNLTERILFVIKKGEIEKLKVNYNQIFNVQQQEIIKSFLEKRFLTIANNHKSNYELFKRYFKELQKQEILLLANKFLIINKLKTSLYDYKDYEQELLKNKVENNLDLIMKSANELRFFGLLNFFILLIYLTTLLFYNFLIHKYQKSLKNEMRYNTILVEEKSSYLANLGHELKNPVSIIVGLTNLFKENLLQKQNFDDIASSITLTSKMISKMINDIMLIDTKNPPDYNNNEINEFNPYSTIKNVVDAFQVIAHQSNLFLELVKNNLNNYTVSGNEMILNQVLFNLLSNAIKYTDKGSVKVYFTINKIKEDKVELKVSVSDTGRGINKSEMPNMFKKYFRASSSLNTTGSGLGLHITQKVLDQVGGNISIESIVNKGSVFTFTIPYRLISINSQMLTRPENSDFISKYLNGKSILIIDDNYSILEYTKHILSKFSNKLLICQNVDEIESTINNEEIALVLTDYYLGNKNGIDVLLLIKSSIPNAANIPVILLSSSPFHSENSNNNTIYKFDGYISKPFSPEDFLDELETILKNKIISI